MEKNEMKCHKCGCTHDKNLIKCPECGHNRFADYGICILTSLVIGFVVFTCIFSLFKITNIENKIKDVSNSVNSIYSMMVGTGEAMSSDQYEISNDEYYQGRELTGNVDLESLGDDYILYFHQYSCSACLNLNTYVKSYIGYGAAENVPVYFVTPDSSNELFENTMFGENGVESTPQMFRMNKSTIVENAVGVDECVELLDNAVNDYKK